MAVKAIAAIGDVLLDMVEADNPTHTYELTEHAVEDGVNISDHMKEQPATVSISGVVVGEDASQRLEKLKKYQRDRELVVYTNRVIYADMAIVSLETTHGKDIANGFSFSITMKRVRIAKPQDIEIRNVPPAIQTKAKETVNAGTKQTKSTKKTKQETSSDLAARIRSALDVSAEYERQV